MGKDLGISAAGVRRECGGSAAGAHPEHGRSISEMRWEHARNAVEGGGIQRRYTRWHRGPRGRGKWSYKKQSG